MTPTWITERCACGAKFEITTTWHHDAAKAADKWRTSHVHIAPDSPLICPESEGTRTPQEPQTGAQPPTVRLDPEWMFDGMWPKRRLSRDVPHANPQRAY